MAIMTDSGGNTNYARRRAAPVLSPAPTPVQPVLTPTAAPQATSRVAAPRTAVPRGTVPAPTSRLRPGASSPGTYSPVLGRVAQPTTEPGQTPEAPPAAPPPASTAAFDMNGPWDANKVRAYYASRNVTPFATSPDYWAGKYNEWGSRDPNTFNSRLAVADEFLGRPANFDWQAAGFGDPGASQTQGMDLTGLLNALYGAYQGPQQQDNLPEFPQGGNTGIDPGTLATLLAGLQQPQQAQAPQYAPVQAQAPAMPYGAPAGGSPQGIQTQSVAGASPLGMDPFMSWLNQGGR